MFSQTLLFQHFLFGYFQDSVQDLHNNEQFFSIINICTVCLETSGSLSYFILDKNASVHKESDKELLGRTVLFFY